jgi:SHS family lactate transporter-like MFS transporter
MLLTTLFPARVRGLSVGIVYHVGALLAAGTSTLVAWLGSGDRLPLGTSIMLVVAAAAVVTVAILVFRPAGALPSSALGSSTPNPGASPAQPQQNA